MSVFLPGNSTSFVDYTAASIAVSSPTQFWMGVRFKLAASIDETGSGTLVRFGPANSGMSVSFSPQGSATVFKTNTRLLVNGSSSTQYSGNIPVTIGEEIEVLIRADYTAGFIEHYVNNVKVFEYLKVEGDTWAWHSFATAAVIPRITGSTVNGKNWEIFDFVGRIGGLITSGEATTFSFATDEASGLSSPPLWGVSPSGTEGAHASSLEDLYGSNDMSQVNGPVSPNAGFPYFTGGPAALLLTDLDYTSTARKITLTGTVPVVDGTLYIVGAPALDWTEAADASDIVAGRLADGTTAAPIFRPVSIVDAEFSEEFVTGIAAEDYIFYLIHDTDDLGAYTEVGSVVASTKIPIVAPASGAVWRGADGQPLASETGMSMSILGAAYTATGLITAPDGTGEVDLTGYVSSGAAVDIGDTISFDITRTNGEILAIRNATITEGA